MKFLKEKERTLNEAFGQSSELDDFGYCKKCSTKLFKQSRHTTIEQIKIEKNQKRD